MHTYNEALKYAIRKDNLIIDIVDEYIEGAIKVPSAVQIGWTYNEDLKLFEPPIPPLGFAYDWQGNNFIPLTEEAKNEQNEYLEKQDLFQRMSAEKFVKESEDLLIQEMIDRGIL